MATEKIKLTVSQVLGLMKGDPTAIPPVLGLDRKQIKAKLGLSHSDMTALFKHPALRNKKAKKEAGFELVDDIKDTSTLTSGNGAEILQAENKTVPVAESAVPDKW